MHATLWPMKGQSILPYEIPEGVWLRSNQTLHDGSTTEVFNEGDGNWLIRPSFNRDRVLRLNQAELMTLVSIVLTGLVEPAPDQVGVH